jgi:hypothetical protein
MNPCFLLALLSTSAVLTQHNDNARTGQNTNETVLTLANVNPSMFGRLFTYNVDGNVYAQPLVVPDVSIPGQGVHAVLYVVTEHDSVYAFDAESFQAPLWQTTFINPAAEITTVPSVETAQGNIYPEVGITSTPVIDLSTATIYIEARTKEVTGALTNYVHRLHALDITTGLERTNFNSPVLITVSNYPGTGTPGYPDNDGAGHVLWNPLREQSRTGLLLQNGVVSFGYASPGDHPPYHGWVLSYDAHTLVQRGAFNTTPNGADGGVWQSGAGLAADPIGNFYLETGNGTFDPANANYGDSVLKLSTSNGLDLADYFTPYDQAYLDAQDLDLGSGGVVVLPDSAGSLAHPHLLVAASKTGTIYLLDRDHLGHFNSNGDTQIVQSLTNAVGGLWCTPAYFNGTLYYMGVNDRPKAFSVSNANIQTSPAGQAMFPLINGGTPSISANGAKDAILWAIQTDNSNGGIAILHAYDASNLSHELYNSSVLQTRDAPGPEVHFAVPTVVNGHVYVGTAQSVAVYGLTNGPPAIVNASASLDANGFHLELPTSPGSTYVLQATTNLTSWTAIQTNVATGRVLGFANPATLSLPYRFYRVAQQP